MNKKELLKILRKEHNDRRDKALVAAEKMYDWLKERKCGKEYIQGSNLQRCYLINGHKCIAGLTDFRNGIVELIPFSAHADIGTGFAGGILRMDFN